MYLFFIGIGHITTDVLNAELFYFEINTEALMYELVEIRITNVEIIYLFMTKYPNNFLLISFVKLLSQ